MKPDNESTTELNTTQKILQRMGVDVTKKPDYTAIDPSPEVMNTYRTQEEDNAFYEAACPKTLAKYDSYSNIRAAALKG